MKFRAGRRIIETTPGIDPAAENFYDHSIIFLNVAGGGYEEEARPSNLAALKRRCETFLATLSKLTGRFSRLLRAFEDRPIAIANAAARDA